MNQLLYNPNVQKAKEKTKVWIIVAIAVFCIILCLSTVFAIANRYNEKILKNVYIDGMDVGNKTKAEALEEVTEKAEEYQNAEIVLSVGNKDYLVSAEDIGFEMEDMENVVESAYAYGRDQNFLANNYTILFSNFGKKEIHVDYQLNEQKINEIVAKISNLSESLVLDDSYVVSGEKLIIQKGQNGLKIDKENLKEYLLSAIKNHVSIVEVPVIESEAKKLDLNKVYEAVYVAPQNASYVSGDKFAFIPEKEGIDFDIVEAKSIYDAMNESGEMEIGLRKLEPSVKVSNLEEELFENTLATASVSYAITSVGKEMVQKINGIILNPNEEFSFQNAVQNVIVLEDGSVIASAIYHAVLKADFTVTQRVAHETKVSYIEPSLDAMVRQNTADFKFKNTSNYPVKLHIDFNNQAVTVSILGYEKPKNQTIELESVTLSAIEYRTKNEEDASLYVGTSKVVVEGCDGCTSEAYKVVKNASGSELSRSLISKDTYAAIDKVVKVGTKVKVITPVTPVKPAQEEVEEETPKKQELPHGWDSPENPYHY